MSVKVVLFEPSAEKRVGGLDLAIRSLEEQLRSANVEVLVNPPGTVLETAAGAVVHFHGLWERTYLRLAARCRKAGIPYVVSPHGMLEPWAFRHRGWKKWPYFYVFERALLRKAQALVATSDLEAYNLAFYTGHRKIPVIPLAVSSDKEPDYEAARAVLGWKADERVLLFLSRIHPKKGLHLLLEALEAIEPERVQPVRLVIVGEGEAGYVRNMRTLSAQLPCRVEWIGPIWGEEKWQYLQGADLFCLPTFSENFGLAVQEACQVGTPVLTTHETPWGFLEEWGSGLIVRPEVDDVRTAVDIFLRAFTWSPRQREDLGRRTRRQFDPGQITRMYLDLYADVLNLKYEKRLE